MRSRDDDPLNPARGQINGLKLALLFFWLPLGLTLLLLKACA